jgi:hypothetical protein
MLVCVSVKFKRRAVLTSMIDLSFVRLGGYHIHAMLRHAQRTKTSGMKHIDLDYVFDSIPI